MRTFLYRVLENDCDGDPLDFGVVKALNGAAAWSMVRRRLRELGIRNVPVRMYPQRDLEEGVLPCDGDFWEKSMRR